MKFHHSTPKRFSNSKRHFVRARRSGVAFVYLAVGMIVFLGITGYVVDVGHLHMKEAQAMRAADAAALAGAMKLAAEEDEAAAEKAARKYVEDNGYDLGDPNVTFRGAISPDNPNWYTVYVSRIEPLFFIRALPKVGSKKEVGAWATAEFTPSNPETIGGGSYSKDGPANLSLYGPQAEYQWGDPYSTIWRDASGTLNKDHIGFEGYNFELNVPADYQDKNGSSIVNLELFDPDTFNSNGSASPNGTSEWDEIRQPYASGPQPASIATQTQFSLYKVNAPNDPSKDTLISKAIYRDDPTTNNKWVTPDGFAIDTLVQGAGQYRINVRSLDGSSENGFDMRAGPPLADGGVYDKDNGAAITASGAIPINFNTSGLVTIELGVVPTAAAGRNLVIDKFDTDVAAKTVFYTSDPPASNQPAGGWPGLLSGNAQWQADVPILLPANYTTAKWYATYQAGWQDTSLWKMSYGASGSPGSVRLVGRDKKSF